MKNYFSSLGLIILLSGSFVYANDYSEFYENSNFKFCMDNNKSMYDENEYMTPNRPLKVYSVPKIPSSEAKADYCLGVIYSNGWGVDRDEKKGLNHFLKSAELGYVYAQSSAGSIYQHGIINKDSDKEMRADWNKAEYWLRKASQDGNDAFAQYSLGKICHSRIGVSGVDDFKILSYVLYFWADKNGYRERGTDNHIDLYYENLSEKEKAQADILVKDIKKFWLTYDEILRKPSPIVAYYLKAADTGNAEAQLVIAEAYRKGTMVGIPLNYAKAVNLYIKAAKNGKAHQASLGLGEMFMNGEGVKKNLIIAYALFDYTAKHADSRAIKAQNDVAQQLSKEDKSEAEKLVLDPQRLWELIDTTL
jgi:TPR repeat protein